MGKVFLEKILPVIWDQTMVLSQVSISQPPPPPPSLLLATALTRDVSERPYTVGGGG